jgi:hypothetical protein
MSHEEKEILKRLLRESKENAEEIARVLHIVREIERELRPQPQPITRSIAVQFTGEPPMPNNALTLNVGQTSQASIQPLLADGVTPSGGTLSAVSYSFADPSATVVINADNLTATVTGVAASTGAVTGVAACTVTDSDGVVSTWSQTFTVTTSGITPPPPPTQLTQSVAVQFSTPTP